MALTIEEGKAKFIEAWGRLASEWGINRTMAQVHALLLLSNQSLNADEVMQQLNISRGNANMNLRSLVDWGLVTKELKQGKRKEYFFAEKDIWKINRQIMLNRKKRELEPLQSLFEELKTVNNDTKDTEAFLKLVNELSDFANMVNKLMETSLKADRNWMLNLLIKTLG